MENLELTFERKCQEKHSRLKRSDDPAYRKCRLTNEWRLIAFSDMTSMRQDIDPRGASVIQCMLSYISGLSSPSLFIPTDAGDRNDSFYQRTIREL